MRSLLTAATLVLGLTMPAVAQAQYTPRDAGRDAPRAAPWVQLSKLTRRIARACGSARMWATRVSLEARSSKRSAVF
jgi:hypothetical protein